MKDQHKDILHAGRLGSISPSAAKYTSSIDIDGRLISAVVAIDSAHAIMLAEQGMIDSSAAGRIVSSLRKIPHDLEMKHELEDVHMNVEDRLISQVGKDVGGMINLGKSRNDQVATALRMTLREELIHLGNSIIWLEKVLLTQAAKNSGSPLPGYTHLQRAQPVTVGHHLLAHYDSLDRNFSRLVDCYLRVNISPMGAGALACSSVPLNRERVAELLGFDSVLENSLDAVSSRDFATESIYLCVQIMTDLSRLAEEIILWTSKEFSFAEISNRHASTSSMMPQKKNAVVAEIFRARTSQVLGDLVGAMGIGKALPLSYNLDLQELTRNLWSALDKSITSVRMLAEVVDAIRFNIETMLEATKEDDFLYATDIADYLVTKFNIPFRDAHGRVGKLVKFCTEKKISFKGAGLDPISRILGVRITSEELNSLTDPTKCLDRKVATGSPRPHLVSLGARKRLAKIRKHEKTLQSIRKNLYVSEKELWSAGDRLKRLSSAKGVTKLNQRR